MLIHLALNPPDQRCSGIFVMAAVLINGATDSNDHPRASAQCIIAVYNSKNHPVLLSRNRLESLSASEGQEMTFSFESYSPKDKCRSSKSATEVGDQLVLVGDCLDILKEIQRETIDVIVTSPPYNIGISYRTYNDKIPREEYLAWLSKVGRELRRVIKPNGSFFLNVGSTNIDPWLEFDVALAFRETFVLQNSITWAKSLSIGDDTVGHFKPISSRRFLNQNHEAIFHFTCNGAVEVDRLAVGVPFKDKTNIARWGHDRDRRCAGNVWFIPYKTVRSKAQKFDHPAGFPVELPERCIKLHGIKDGIVLDPFLGAGSTLVAAERLGLQGVGIEIDPVYAETAIERLRSGADASPMLFSA